MAAQEVEYYRSGNVLITNSRAEFSGTTYAMVNVTSVKMNRTDPDTGCAMWMFGIGGLLLIGGFAALNDGGIAILLVGLILVVVGVLVYRSLKPTYSVILGSASGEVSAMTSEDQEEIGRIMSAIKKAIIQRG